MNFTYTATGSIQIGGCVHIGFKPYFPSLYVAGDVVFRRDKAFKGKFEQLVIKRVILNRDFYTLMQPIFVYMDRENACWLEYELITQDEAMILVERYWANWEANNAQRALQCQPCNHRPKRPFPNEVLCSDPFPH